MSNVGGRNKLQAGVAGEPNLTSLLGLHKATASEITSRQPPPIT